MSFKIIPTPNFEKEAKKLAKKYVSLKSDFKILFSSLIENPDQGVEIYKNCYKIRFSIKSKNKGKSGGGRLIFFLKRIENKIFLLSVFDKSEQETISDKFLKELLISLEIKK